METIAGIFVLVILAVLVAIGVMAEVKCMRKNAEKAEEEIKFFRSFRKYLEKLEETFQ